MAFHFNWSPLIADTDRVRHMLTASLNKSPKPPIIVSEILVTELNLGSTPPSLEILEVGDLAEDKFRGVFRVKYEGDAYLTLRTRVQANPLNTFLSAKSDWTNPGVGAAGGGLTIPLQISLSEIRLSGFVILVFSKQKGITLVFRNDPLESLKVSSTFDSIPFVREYLQRTIEGQLRVLFMEDLPAIIHRLSLRVFGADGQVAEKDVEGNREVERRLDESDRREGMVDGEEGYELDEGQGDTYANFSQKNLVRLAALAESQRTLSLFTPGLRDTVYRAWATSGDRSAELRDGAAMPGMPQRPTTLSRIQSTLNMSHPPPESALSSAASFTSETAASHATRPSMASMASAPTTYTLGSTTQSRPRPRKRKNRVVNLRKNRGEGSTDTGSDAVSISSGYETASRTESLNRSTDEASTGMAKDSGSTVPTSTSSLRPREREGEVYTPDRSPKKKVGWRESSSIAKPGYDSLDFEGSSHVLPKPRQRPITPRNPHLSGFDDDETPRQSMYLPPQDEQHEPSKRRQRPKMPHTQTLPNHPAGPSQVPQQEPPQGLSRSSSDLSINDMVSGFPSSQEKGAGSNGGILEQAWMMKMAREIAERVAEEKAKGRVWRPGDHGEEAPPAYVS